MKRTTDSPGINAGRGLKQRCWVRLASAACDSPGINAGRGLKLVALLIHGDSTEDSPGINAGRGLKQRRRCGYVPVCAIRPVLMPGVD